METKEEKEEIKPIIIQPDDLHIEIDDLLAGKFTVKQDKQEVTKNG